MRHSSDRLYARTFGPRETEALAIVTSEPGISISELQDRLGVGRARVWQIVERLESGRVRRDGDAPARRLRPSSAASSNA